MLLVLGVVNDVDHPESITLFDDEVKRFLSWQSKACQSFVQEVYVVNQVTLLVDVLIDTRAHVAHAAAHPGIEGARVAGLGEQGDCLEQALVHLQLDETLELWWELLRKVLDVFVVFLEAKLDRLFELLV